MDSLEQKTKGRAGRYAGVEVVRAGVYRVCWCGATCLADAHFLADAGTFTVRPHCRAAEVVCECCFRALSELVQCSA